MKSSIPTLARRHHVRGLNHARYDGDGHRVEKNNAGSITYYWYDDDFKVVSTTGNLVRDYVYFNGRRVAHLSLSNGNQYYYWLDHLGNTRTITNSDGSSIQWEGDYYPFGGANVLNNFVTNKFRFTDYEWDSELGDNYADYREQSPVLGRFFSPDTYSGSVALANPQSLNRYAYVMNNPMNSIDPLGLCGETWNPATNTENWDDTGCVSSDYYWLMFFANSFFDPPQPASTGGSGGSGGDSTPQAPLSPKDQGRLDKAKKLALDDIFSKDCMAFCLSHGIDPTYLAVAVLNQQGFNGRQSTITQAAAGTYIGGDVNATVASQFKSNSGVSAAASTNGSFDVYYRPGGIFSSGGINEGTVEHEALHNLTRKSDSQLQSLFGLEQISNDTTNITQALKDHHCSH